MTHVDLDTVRRNIASLAAMYGDREQIILTSLAPIDSHGEPMPGDMRARFDEGGDTGTVVAWDGERWIDVCRARFVV